MQGASLLAAVLVTLAVGAMLAGAYQLRSAKHSLRERVESFIQRPVASLAEVELQRPFADRVVRPLLRRLSSVAGRVLPQRALEQTRRELLLAGGAWRLPAIDFLGLRLIAALALGALGLLFTATRGMALPRLLLISIALAGLGSYLPGFWLKRRIKSRQHEIIRALPDALDMLTICVGAGLAFDLAMLKIGEKWDNSLAQEFNRVVAEMRMGIERQEALRRMADRTGVADVGSFVAVLVQADQLGVSIEQVLHAQSHQLRIRRRQRAEELANQAPIKMIFPLVFLIFPALFAILLGPAVPAFLEALNAMR